MANSGLREACAEILEALTGSPVVHGNPRKVGRLMRGADTLRWAERFEYGDPVPADEVQAQIDAAVEEARESVEDEFAAEREAYRKAFENFAAAMVAFDDSRDDVKALLDAWDEYRAVRA